MVNTIFPNSHVNFIKRRSSSLVHYKNNFIIEILNYLTQILIFSSKIWLPLTYPINLMGQ